MNDKKIGLGSVIATGVGLVVASSCLLTLGIGAGSIGTPFIITMIIACCVNILTLLSIAELNSMMPDLTGGLAQFSLACVGPFITIICMVGGYLLCNSLAGSVEGAVFGNTFAEMFAGLGLPAWVFSLVLIAFLAITNLNGVDVFIKVQDFVAYALIFSLVAMGIMGAFGLGTGEIVEQTETSPTLARNSIGRHQSRIAYTKVVSNKSPWLYGCEVGDIHTVAISHGEGRFVAPASLIQQLANNGQIATQYVDLDGNPTMDIRYNPNTSIEAIEGITSPDGRVFGKMGHSERKGSYICKNVQGEKDQKIFESGVKYFT